MLRESPPEETTVKRRPYGRGGGVGRGLGVGVDLGAAVAVGVAVAVAVGVGVGLWPPPWKLNLPMRVFQLKLLVVA